MGGASSGITELGKEVRKNRGGEGTLVTRNSRNGKAKRNRPRIGTLRLRSGQASNTDKRAAKKGNRRLRGGRGSDSLFALRPAACAQAFGRKEWVLVVRFPSDESLGFLVPSRGAGLTPIALPGPP